jgi:hypothetical protein
MRAVSGKNLFERINHWQVRARPERESLFNDRLLNYKRQARWRSWVYHGLTLFFLSVWNLPVYSAGAMKNEKEPRKWQKSRQP